MAQKQHLMHRESETTVVIHYPNLSTVLAVEKVLRGSGVPLSKNEIKRRLGAGIMHQTLNVVIDYLEERGLVYVGPKGVLWIYNPNKKLRKAIDGGIEA